MKQNYRVKKSDGSIKDCIINEIYNITCIIDKNNLYYTTMELFTPDKDIVIRKLVEDLIETNHKMHMFQELSTIFMKHTGLPQETKNEMEAFLKGTVTSTKASEFSQPMVTRTGYLDDIKTKSK